MPGIDHTTKYFAHHLENEEDMFIPSQQLLWAYVGFTAWFYKKAPIDSDYNDWEKQARAMFVGDLQWPNIKGSRKTDTMHIREAVITMLALERKIFDTDETRRQTRNSSKASTKSLIKLAKRKFEREQDLWHIGP